MVKDMLVQVRSDPRTVLKLRCLFIKMRSLLEVPLLRLGQARAPAVAATSRVYSSALLAFSRRLLQVNHLNSDISPFLTCEQCSASIRRLGSGLMMAGCQQTQNV